VSTHIEVGSDSDSPVGRAPSEGTRQRQEIFLLEYAKTASLSASSAKAGVSEATARHWMRGKNAEIALHRIRERLLRTEGASVGLRVLLEIAEDTKAPSHVRRAAAKDLLGLGGHSEAVAAAQAAAEVQRKGLEDMTADELERVAAAAAATLAQLRRQSATVDVTPDPPDPPEVTPALPDASSLL